MEIIFSQVGPAGWVGFSEVGHFFQPPLSFSANRENVNFGKMKNDKSVFSDISWPLTSPLYWIFLRYFEFDLSH